MQYATKKPLWCSHEWKLLALGSDCDSPCVLVLSATLILPVGSGHMRSKLSLSQQSYSEMIVQLGEQLQLIL